jgi:hypothetical protein
LATTSCGTQLRSNFAIFIRIGDGDEPTVPDPRGTSNLIRLPDEMVVKSMDELIDFVFPNYDRDTLCGNVILAPTNAHVDKVNDNVLKRMPGESKEFLSFDSVEVLIIQTHGKL